MPSHPVAQPRYRNIVQLKVPTFAEGLGYTRIAKSGPGTSWRVESIWLSNWNTTLSFQMTLNRVPFNWPSVVSDDHLVILRGLELGPSSYLTVPVSFVLYNGDALWAYQIESNGAAVTGGITMVIAAEEGR